MLSGNWSETTLYCPECRAAHPARSLVENGEMFLYADCPKGTRRVRLSSDAALFQLMRDKAHAAPPDTTVLTHNHFLHITDRCNLHCPVCFADSAGAEPWSMSLPDLHFRAAAIRRDRGHFVTLSGGEPSEHPDILRIVSILHRKYSLSVSILTNGIRLGSDPEFAGALKEAGLRKAAISFDTFRPETSVKIRGANLVDIKLQAFRNCWNAGLNTGINSTICRENLSETGDLLRFGIENAPRVTILLLQPLQTVGRLTAHLGTVDREEILKMLAASGVVPGLRATDFFPMPLAPGFGLCVHPDCGAMQILSLHANPRAIHLLEHEINLEGLLYNLARQPFANRFFSRVRFGALLLRHGGIPLLKNVFRWIHGGIGDSIFLFGVDNLMGKDRQDSERILRCASRRCERDGSMSCVCHHYAFHEGEKESDK